MHDFLLAKEIISELKSIIKERKLKNVKSVSLEIGQYSSGKHSEDINLDNLKFGLRNITKNTAFKKARFNIKRAEGNDWKITEIEVE